MISFYLAGEKKIRLFKILDSDLLFIGAVFQLSSDFNCHPILPTVNYLKPFNSNDKSQQKNLT